MLEETDGTDDSPAQPVFPDQAVTTGSLRLAGDIVPAGEGGVLMTDLIESEDELLDPQPGRRPPRRTGWPPPCTGCATVAAAHPARDRSRTAPAAGPGRPADPGRGGRGRGDRGGRAPARPAPAQAHTQDRMLLHLLGGSATLSLSELGPYPGTITPEGSDTPMEANFSIALRNDGAKPLRVDRHPVQDARGRRDRHPGRGDHRPWRRGVADRPDRRALQRRRPPGIPVRGDGDRAHRRRQGQAGRARDHPGAGLRPRTPDRARPARTRRSPRPICSARPTSTGPTSPAASTGCVATS